jgi:hypothetical protein
LESAQIGLGVEGTLDLWRLVVAVVAIGVVVVERLACCTGIFKEAHKLIDNELIL